MALLALAVDASALDFERRVVDARVSSGGEVALDERRGLFLIADRDAVSADTIRPGVSVVDARRHAFVRTIAFWTQPLSPGEATAGENAGAATPGLVPQVPSGIDSDTRRGLLVTSNSQSDRVTVAPVGVNATTAANLVPVGDHPFGVAIDERRGEAYVAMYGSDRVDVIEVRARRVVRSIGGVTAPTKLALGDDGRTLYVGNADRTTAKYELAVVDTRSGAVTARLPVDPNSRPTVDPESGVVFAASFDTGRIAVIDPGSETVRAWIDTGSTPHGVAVDARRNLLYAPNLTRNTVTVIDRRTLEIVATESVAGVPLGIAVDERTGWAAITARDASTLTFLRPRPRAEPTRRKRRPAQPG
ncbi:MAG: YncE family protein [Solirubrobacteraceae bacterium]|nr:YncE family protein [Solirubrobacteraceae bacterium]